MNVKGLLSYFLPKAPIQLVYMLQQVEYDPIRFAEWLKRLPNLMRVMLRQRLVWTTKAKALVGIAYLAWLAPLFIAAVLVPRLPNNVAVWMVLICFMPVLCILSLYAAVLAGRVIVAGPQEKKHIAAARQIFAEHPALKIAVAGSYGKTTMKELLLTVLSEGKNVAATPANKNVAISHALFAKTLKGDEDILIIEYGEGKPGDVKQFAEYTHPNYGIITGLAPAHLDQYKTLQAAGEDIFSLAEYLKDEHVYVNVESQAVEPFVKPPHHRYSAEGVGSWTVSDITLSLTGTGFTIKKGDRRLELHSGLLGRHQVGPLALCVALAAEFGLNNEQIEAGIAKTVPFEARMQPVALGGAWVINDGYNANIDGIRAGLQLLQELPAKRKIYVTPGLVDQGEETERVHLEMGRLIAVAKPGQVVLMQNSATEIIRRGLQDNGYSGEVHIETKPLDFYTNLDQFVAAGDLVMFQNDWTDNYN